MGKMFFIVVDAYSKWIQALAVTTAIMGPAQLHMLFATHSLPDVLVSENGMYFTSDEFKGFLKRNGIHHKTSPPIIWLQMVMQSVRFKPSRFKMQKMKGDNMETRLSQFLLKYCIISQGVTTAEMLKNCRLRSAVDLFNQSINKTSIVPISPVKPGSVATAKSVFNSTLWSGTRFKWTKRFRRRLMINMCGSDE